MSKRSKRRRAAQEAAEERAVETKRPDGGEADARAARASGRAERAGTTGSRPRGPASATSTWGLGVQLAFVVAVFAVVVLLAELAGAANLGVALGVGQVAFAIAVVYLLVRR